MSSPRQRRFGRLSRSKPMGCLGALAAAGVIAATPAVAPVPQLHVRDIQLAAGEADMILDFVRHGQSTDNVNFINGTVAPGAHLTAEGQQQAEAVAPVLQQEFPDGIDGIYASGLVRTQETAAPFADLEHMQVTDLSGLNEINAGIWEGLQEPNVKAFEEVALTYLAAPMLWTLGLYSVPLLGSSDFNGMAFENRFNEAVETIYNAGGPLIDGKLQDVAFSHGGAIMIWTMMNVKNPDLSLILKEPLTNTSQVEIEGNPTDGWTLVNWDGTAVPQDPGLATELFVDFRNLITVPQMAAFHIQEALLTLDPTQIQDAIQNGIQSVGTALAQFPEAVINDIVGAAHSSGTETVGALPGELGATVGDALAST